LTPVTTCPRFRPWFERRFPGFFASSRLRGGLEAHRKDAEARRPAKADSCCDWTVRESSVMGDNASHSRHGSQVHSPISRIARITPNLRNKNSEGCRGVMEKGSTCLTCRCNLLLNSPLLYGSKDPSGNSWRCFSKASAPRTTCRSPIRSPPTISQSACHWRERPQSGMFLPCSQPQRTACYPRS